MFGYGAHCSCWIRVCYPSPSFNERVELIVEHERSSARERAQAMASEERDLIDLFRRAEMDYETRLLTQVMVPGECFRFLRCLRSRLGSKLDDELWNKKQYCSIHIKYVAGCGSRNPPFLLYLACHGESHGMPKSFVAD